MTVAEWVRQALREARKDRYRTVESKLRAIEKASRFQFPTADIEVMLQEIDAGSARRGYHSDGGRDLGARALHVAIMRDVGAERIFSFDRGFDRILSIEGVS